MSDTIAVSTDAVTAEVPLTDTTASNSAVQAPEQANVGSSAAPVEDGRLVPKAKWNAFKAAVKGCAESTPSKIACLILSILLALVFAALFVLEIAGYATMISGT